ncbi:MAG TPA: prepilin-type N-terminal cleavage/methylation domain-containing protein [Tepidisphaeraceae bacterium]|jgi:general secretion pathway protein G
MATRKTKAKKTRKNRGFTLIEILIVVIILGILAAIVIPQFTNASTEAKQSSLASQLQTLRSQVQLYNLQHAGSSTAALTTTNFWAQLEEASDSSGTAYVSGTSTTGPWGPYFEANVTNPLTNSSAVASNSTPAAGDAWEFNPANGEVHGVIPNPAGSGFVISDDGQTTASWNSAPSGS